MTYVLTYNPETSNVQNICFVNMDVCQLIDKLKKEKGKLIWICGGAKLAYHLMEKNRIDTYYLVVVPIILGDGIKLFDTPMQRTELILPHTQNYSGIVQIVYNRKIFVTVR